MLAHQERVVQEKQELDDKISKLDAFVEGKIFPTLPEDEQNRLVDQVAVMKKYSAILGERITAFRPEKLTIVP